MAINLDEAKKLVLYYRINRLYLLLLLILWNQPDIGTAQEQSRSLDSVSPSRRLNYHTAPAWTNPLMKEQHHYTIPSPLILDDGTKVDTPEDWYQKRRPELVRHWMKIFGKLSPSKADEKWFGDIRKIVIHDTEEKEGYTRIHLSIPIEKDFLQPHLLLLPKNQGPSPFPAVIAWTSTSPDYMQPEQWWGKWLAQRGYVVLTGWSFIRHYRDGKTYRDQVNEIVYERFGHWLPMAKMVHDVQREVEYLSTLPDVDPNRLGFIGFSLSAKTALYVAAFAPEIKATVAVDPHLAMHGDTNYHDLWYLDWRHKFDSIKTDDYPVPELRGTIWSLLDADPSRPGFERNHHELIALCAPRAFLLIGCSMDKTQSTHSDNLQSWGYFNRAKEVYDFLGISDRIEFETTTDGHQATSPRTDSDWQQFFEQWLKKPSLKISRARDFKLGESAEREEGFVSLFDGKTLNGWQGATEHWAAEEGSLVFIRKGAARSKKELLDLKLMSIKEYVDFILRFDIKLPKESNNGVAIRAPLEGDPAFVGMEIQVQDPQYYRRLKDYEVFGSIYGVVPAKTGHLKPNGQWNTEEILCVGRHVKVTLNGTVIVDANLDSIGEKTIDGANHPGLQRKKGHIGFCGHTGRVAFRNIRIKDLSGHSMN